MNLHVGRAAHVLAAQKVLRVHALLRDDLALLAQLYAALLDVLNGHAHTGCTQIVNGELTLVILECAAHGNAGILQTAQDHALKQVV